MLEHQKIIVKNVSHNKILFEKEIKKSLKWLDKNDLLAFNQWVVANLYDKYPDIISKYFEKPAA